MLSRDPPERRRKVLGPHGVGGGTDREQRGLVDHVGEFGPGEARRELCNGAEVDVRVEPVACRRMGSEPRSGVRRGKANQC